MIPRRNRSAGFAALLLMLAALFSATSAAATNAPSASSRAASPEKINDLADAFLIEKGGTWFCKDTKNSPPTKLCPRKNTSWDAATGLLLSYMQYASSNPGAIPDYMRVAKARNDCRVGQKANCDTGVPRPLGPSSNCALPFARTTPRSCALAGLNYAGVRLGIVVSASGKGKRGRPVDDIAWQACQINKTDTSNYYSFMFLDLASRLSDQELKRAVRMIQGGRIKRRGTAKEENCTRPVVGKNGKKNRRHVMWQKLIINDRNYRPNRADRLKNGAWAHAADITLLGSNANNRNVGAALKHKKVLRPLDKSFFRAVRRAHSQAVLRFEVTSQTGRLSRLRKGLQKRLLSFLASRQKSNGYTLDFPFYVHGLDEGRPGPSGPKDRLQPTYDSFALGTFDLQSRLISRFDSH